MKPSIVYTAFGPVHLHKQAICSILTLWHHLGGTTEFANIVVYTDDDEPFRRHLDGIQVNYEVLSPEIFQAFKGPRNFSFRVKMCVIREYFRKYQSDVFFVDTDTFFIASPVKYIQAIGPDTTVFHAYEYTANDGNTHEGKVWLQFRKIVKNNEFTVWGKKGKLGMDSEMWNSGVLGISYSNQNLVDVAIDLADQITEVDWLKTGEQFAFSYVFQKKTKLIQSDDVVFHYWLASQKELYNFHIARMLPKLIGQPVATRAANAAKLAAQRAVLRLPEKNLWQRLALRGSLIMQVARTGHL